MVFEPGTPLEVVGDRELAFFPGIARGCAFPGTQHDKLLLPALWFDFYDLDSHALDAIGTLMY